MLRLKAAAAMLIQDSAVSLFLLANRITLSHPAQWGGAAMLIRTDQRCIRAPMVSAFDVSAERNVSVG